MLISILVPIVTLVAGGFLGAWFTIYISRPKLMVGGSGGGGGGAGPGHSTNYVRIRNQHGFVGISIKQTIIFGKRLHGRIDKGLSVDRSPANECSASIRDKETGEYIASLWWRPLDVVDVAQSSVNIKSGEDYDLMLFARLNDEPTSYFVYQSKNGTMSDVLTPPDDVRFHHTKRFVVQVDYSYHRQKFEFDVTVRKGLDGRLSYQTTGGGGSF